MVVVHEIGQCGVCLVFLHEFINVFGMFKLSMSSFQYIFVEWFACWHFVCLSKYGQSFLTK